jgi:hypothetical protein
MARTEFGDKPNSAIAIALYHKTSINSKKKIKKSISLSEDSAVAI